MRYPALDGLRGVLAIVILLGHSSFYGVEPLELLRAMPFLVEVFFLVSGFLAGAAIDRVGTPQGEGLGAFLVRRLDRLYPLYLFALLVWVPFVAARWLVWSQAGIGVDPFERHTAEQFVMHLFLLQSVFGDIRAGWNYADWYVSALFIALAALYGFARVAGRFRNAWLPVLLAGVCYALLYVLTEDHLLIHFHDVGFLRGIAACLLGLALYRITRDGVRLSTGPVAGTLLEVAVIAATCVVFLYARTGEPMRQYLVVPVLCLAVFVFIQQGPGLLTRLLSTRALVRLGGLSYGIYLLHGIVLVVAINIAQYLLHIPLHSVGGGDTGAVKLGVFSVWSPLVNLVLVVSVVALSAGVQRWVEPRLQRGWLALRRRLTG